MCAVDGHHRCVGGHAVRRPRCDAQVPNADPAVAAAGAEQTGVLWVPLHRFDGARVSAQEVQGFAGGDVCDAGGVVPGAGGQGRVVRGPLEIEYPVLVNVKVDPVWLWQIKSRDNLTLGERRLGID